MMAIARINLWKKKTTKKPLPDQKYHSGIAQGICQEAERLDITYKPPISQPNRNLIICKGTMYGQNRHPHPTRPKHPLQVSLWQLSGHLQRFLLYYLTGHSSFDGMRGTRVLTGGHNVVANECMYILKWFYSLASQ